MGLLVPHCIALEGRGGRKRPEAAWPFGGDHFGGSQVGMLRPECEGEESGLAPVEMGHHWASLGQGAKSSGESGG